MQLLWIVALMLRYALTLSSLLSGGEGESKITLPFVVGIQLSLSNLFLNFVVYNVKRFRVAFAWLRRLSQQIICFAFKTAGVAILSISFSMSNCITWPALKNQSQRNKGINVTPSKISLSSIFSVPASHVKWLYKTSFCDVQSGCQQALNVPCVGICFQAADGRQIHLKKTKKVFTQILW